MALEHYPGMTEKAIEAMIDAARSASTSAKRGSSTGWACCIRRTRSCWWPSRSAHRGEAFEACEFLMDYLKTQAPFWKKETRPRARAGSTRACRRRRAGALGPPDRQQRRRLMQTPPLVQVAAVAGGAAVGALLRWQTGAG